ncbi:IgGFc-binding protein-like [Astyanax mexicanus]|uniref:IgGFc-binding protein-like n=1 Tax=Astyanax mexicanus TaxID=7994 RepID=A0A8T2MJZ9_ASTMX|nr:IgGFc-binding protein-like [Astyanax mexicanus]
MLTILLFISLFNQGHAVVEYGMDFVTAFPVNIASYYPSNVNNTLKITALHSNTKFSVSINGSNFLTEVLNAGQSKSVDLPNEVEEQQLGRSMKSVRITSDNNITVFSISTRGNSVQTNVVQPVSNLGKMYQIPFLNLTELILLLNDYSVSNWTNPSSSSNLNRTYNFFRVLVINAEDKSNMVTVTMTQNQKSTFTLSPFEFILMQGNDSLVKISADANISVLLTHPCLDASYCRCTMVVHQLRPTNLLGNRFLVPPFYITNYSRMFSTSDKIVELQYGSPPFAGSQRLMPSSSNFLPFFQSLKDGFSNITTSQPVSLSLIRHGSLIDLIPISMFSACYLVHSTSQTKSLAVIIVETAQVPNMRLNNGQFSPTAVWNAINGTQYSWARVDLSPLKSQVIWHPYSKIAVYVFEKMATGVPYGGPAISVNDNPDPYGCLVSPNLFTVKNESLSWPESRLYCLQKSGYLASPSWPEAQSYMAQQLAADGVNGQAWIGLRRSLLTHQWYWQTGQSLSFSNWDSDQQGGPEKGLCVSVKMDRKGKYGWSTARCCSTLKPMCFIPATYLILTN